MTGENVLDEYQNGWKSVRKERVYYCVTPSDEQIEFGRHYTGRWRSRVFTALCVHFGKLPLLDDPEIIPTKVAIAGKPEILGYLWSVHQEEFTLSGERYPTQLFDRLDITRETAVKYRRRVLNSVKDKKVGGTHY